MLPGTSQECRSYFFPDLKKARLKLRNKQRRLKVKKEETPAVKLEDVDEGDDKEWNNDLEE